jgi:hypothetical protein
MHRHGHQPKAIKLPSQCINLIQAPAIFEEQVAAVFKLARAVGVAKIGALLFIAR